MQFVINVYIITQPGRRARNIFTLIHNMRLLVLYNFNLLWVVTA